MGFERFRSTACRQKWVRDNFKSIFGTMFIRCTRKQYLNTKKKLDQKSYKGRSR